MSRTTIIIIGACGSVFILILLAVACVFCNRRKEKNETKAFMDEAPLKEKDDID